jgi:hypothetical protein
MAVAVPTVEDRRAGLGSVVAVFVVVAAGDERSQ